MNPLLDTIAIKFFPDVTKVLFSPIDTSIKEGGCSDARKKIVNWTNYGEFIMWSCIIVIVFILSMFSWMRLAYMLINVIDTTKNVIDIALLFPFGNILLSSLWLINHAHTYHQQDGYYFTQQFFIQIKIHISQISTIWTKIRA